MCFSPQADLVGGIVVGAIGLDAVRNVHKRHDHIALATLPLLLGAHQVIEAFVWLGLQGHMPHEAERIALWAYLLIAFVVLPIFVPLAVLSNEPQRQRRWFMAPLVVLGMAVAAVLFTAMVRGPVNVRLRPYHLAYGIQLSHGGVIVGLYVLAVCGTLLLSSRRRVVTFGVVNVIAVGIIAWLTIDGFASVWCGWAAITSGAIALHMRVGRSKRLIPLDTGAA
ncbi:MAG: DUF6629 family protein [Acidimicrobiales bacterium]